MMKFANTATNAYACNMLGAESKVLRKKRTEVVNKKTEFAEIGMKAALLAAQYPKFDRHCDGSIGVEDIARCFAAVGNGKDGPSETQAFMIARNILRAADTEPAENPDEDPPGLTFPELITCVEGDAIDFQDLLADMNDEYDHLKAKHKKTKEDLESEYASSERP